MSNKAKSEIIDNIDTTNNITEENNQTENNEKPVKHSLFSRILAIVLLLIFVVILIGYIYTIVTKSKYTFSMLFIVIIYPLIVYLILWLKRVFDRKED